MKQDINLKVKLYLQDSNDKFMGIGVLWLLQNIEKFNSLRKAASEMGISYSKAYRMISNLEEALNKQIISRNKGGQNHNGSTLTPFAIRFMHLYDQFQQNCKNQLQKPFEKFQKDLDKIIKGTEK